MGLGSQPTIRSVSSSAFTASVEAVRLAADSVWRSRAASSIVFGELAVGLGLIVGAFVGLAAFGGLLMNMAFLLAGTTSTNPVLVILGMLLILAWKNAGYFGLDYFLLPMLGTPWKQKKARVGVAPTPVATPAQRTAVGAAH